MVILTKKNSYKLKSCKTNIKFSKMRGGVENSKIKPVENSKKPFKPNMLQSFLITPEYVKYKSQIAENQRIKNANFLKTKPFREFGDTHEVGMKKFNIIEQLKKYIDITKYIDIKDDIRKYNVIDLTDFLEYHKIKKENYEKYYSKAQTFVNLGDTLEVGIEKVPIIEELGRYMVVTDYFRRYSVEKLKGLLEYQKKKIQESKNEKAKTQNQQNKNEAERLKLINELEYNTPIYNPEKYRRLYNTYKNNIIKKQTEATKKGLSKRPEITNYIKELLNLQQHTNKSIQNKSSQELKDYLKSLKINLNSKGLSEIKNRLMKIKSHKQIAIKGKAEFFKNLNLIRYLSLDDLTELRDKYNKYKQKIIDGNKFEKYKKVFAIKALIQKNIVARSKIQNNNK